MKKIFALLIAALAISSPNLTRGAANVMKRELNDGWRFRQERIGSSAWAGYDVALDTIQWRPAKVPGTNHLDLYASKLIGDPYWRMNEKDQQWIDKVNWEYETTFDAKDVMGKDSIQLVFNGLDTRAVVTLNGKQILYADNMWRRWKVDVKGLLKPTGNRLNILFISPVIAGLRDATALGIPVIANNDQAMLGGVGTTKVSPFTRKAGYHFGWDLTGRFVTSGIWKPVELVAWDKARLDDVYIYTKTADKKKADMGIDIAVSSAGKADYTVDVQFDGKPVKTLSATVNGQQTLKDGFMVEAPRLWYPNGDGPANLYTLKVVLRLGGKVLDQRTMQVGIRNMRLLQEPDKDGNGTGMVFEINGKRTFCKGADWVASDMFMPLVTHERLEHLVKSCADANMNMLRVWGGANYEDDYFYELCDKYGIMVWQEFMFAVALYPAGDHMVNNIRAEAIDNVERIRNHPSIVIWCGNNEIESTWQPWDTIPRSTWRWKRFYSEDNRKMWDHAYDTIFHKVLPEVVKNYTYENVYWRSSPSSQYGVGFYGPIDKDPDPKYPLRYGDVHQWEVCHGRQPMSYYDENVGRFTTEFGMIGYNEIASMKNYLDPKDMVFKGDVLTFHSRFRVAQTVELYLNRYFRMPKKFEDIVYMSQVMQGAVVAHGIKAHRRNMPWCMGSLYWQVNDSWPGDTWASLDYYGRWKALHYMARRAFARVSLMPYRHDDVVDLYMVSDRPDAMKGTMDVTMMDFDGNKLKSEQLKVTMPANASKNFKTYKESDLLGGADRDNVVMVCKFTGADKTETTYLEYMDTVKLLKLPPVNIQFETLAGPGGTVTVRVTTDKLAKSVAVYYNGEAGIFSDNFFDLLPGETHTITLPTKDSPEAVLKGLTWNTVNDVYSRL